DRDHSFPDHRYTGKQIQIRFPDCNSVVATIKDNFQAGDEHHFVLEYPGTIYMPGDVDTIQECGNKSEYAIIETAEMRPQDIHKHAFWLYGVVVGLAIREALNTIVPHI